MEEAGWRRLVSLQEKTSKTRVAGRWYQVVSGGIMLHNQGVWAIMVSRAELERRKSPRILRNKRRMEMDEWSSKVDWRQAEASEALLILFLLQHNIPRARGAMSCSRSARFSCQARDVRMDLPTVTSSFHTFPPARAHPARPRLGGGGASRQSLRCRTRA